MKDISSPEYLDLLGEVKERIRIAQYNALRAVNKELISLYWDIGKMIIERQKGKSWGKSVVEQLSKDLQRELTGVLGFSTHNLWRMKQFYQSYAKNEKLAQLVLEIGWGHNVFIMQSCKNDLEKEFYIKMTKKMGWSRSVLVHQVENKTYEKVLLNQTNFKKTLPLAISQQAKLAVKDEYTFDFLELGDSFNERQLETAILAKIQNFLKEMGGVFSFIGNQYRIEVEGDEYFIDLLLYHRGLKALIAVELKVGKFLPEYVGKMQFYLTLLDEKTRMKGENPPIGIILCKTKKKTMVEYALRDTNKPIGVASYKIVTSLPNNLKGRLPDPDQIAKLLDDF